MRFGKKKPPVAFDEGKDETVTDPKAPERPEGKRLGQPKPGEGKRERKIWPPVKSGNGQ